jgi:acetyl-CoA C-acetyltransferase
MAREAVIVSAVRTPIGKFMGALGAIPSPRLGSLVVRAAVERAGIRASDVDEVLMGCVLQAGLGQNPARQAAIGAGIPNTASAMTVNMVCGSGMKSVMLAAQAVRAGEADVVVAGGMESMSLAPYLVPEARTGARLGHGRLVDAMIHDGLWDVYNDFHMGHTAELVAQKFGITRERQDAYAAESHRKAVAATKAGKFAAEIVPVEIPQKKGEALRVEADEGPREDSTADRLAKLKPAFKPEGTVTAGNASQISDGAAALVVMSAEKAKSVGARPLARITAFAAGGVAPEWVMMAPVEAAANLARRGGLPLREYDLVELNEAFAAQAVALLRELKLDPERVNVHGGAVALGHPIGASGARILVTLLHALKDRGLRRGAASLCLGGGNATALAVELV